MFGDDLCAEIFTEFAILPVQCSHRPRSAGVKEAVENFYPLVTFGLAYTSGENIFFKLYQTSTVQINMQAK